MTEPTPDAPPTPPDETPLPDEDPGTPTPDPDPEPEPGEPTPEYCTSQCPRDPSITCELPYGHSDRMIHRRGGGPDQPYNEWE